MSKPTNVTELRDQLLDAFELVKKDARRANQVTAMHGVAGKVLGTVKSQMVYALLRNEVAGNPLPRGIQLQSPKIRQRPRAEVTEPCKAPEPHPFPRGIIGGAEVAYVRIAKKSPPMMNPADHFFITESVRHAKSLPYSDCLKYLRGMLRSCGDTDEVGDLRRVVSAISANDAQLDLIAGGQLKFDLDETDALVRAAGRAVGQLGRKGARRR